MTNAVTAGRLAGSLPTTPQQARTAWAPTAAMGAVLLVLGVLAVAWRDGGARLLLAGVGVLAVVRGVAMLRGVRAGRLERDAAPFGAAATWLGVVAAVVALVSGTATGWVLAAAVVLAPPAVALSLGRQLAAAWAGAAVLLAGAVVVALTASAGALLTTAAVVAGVVAAAVGVVDLVGAAGMVRLARRPEPAPAAGCGSCACGSGGCGVLR